MLSTVITGSTRSEDFLLHYGICARDSIHHRWLNLKPLCIRMSAENNLLRIYKAPGSVKMFLIYDFTVSRAESGSSVNIALICTDSSERKVFFTSL